MQKLADGRHLIQQGEDLQREAAAEMQEVEAFERLMKSLPTSEEELHAIESGVAHTRTNASVAARTAHLISSRDLIPSSFRTQRDQASALCFQILSDGRWRTTEELVDELTKRGFVLTAENKLQRLSQILSMNEQFKNQRGRGWSLDVSSVLDVSSANETSKSRMSSEDEMNARLTARARELARNDGNSAR